jgi:branched-subunit amino acid permease
VFTCTGAANVRPPSRLTATYTSAVFAAADAPQATATKSPLAAIQGVAFARSGTRSVTAAASVAPADIADIADAATVAAFGSVPRPAATTATDTEAAVNMTAADTKTDAHVARLALAPHNDTDTAGTDITRLFMT